MAKFDAIGNVLLANEISEVCDGVLWIPDELRLCLCALELFALNVGKDGWDLTICAQMSAASATNTEC